MNRLHLRVEDKLQALSAHVPTLDESWQMKSVILFAWILIHYQVASTLFPPTYSTMMYLCVMLKQEILASVMIKNLDTGEEIPLIQAEEKLPAGINPLTLHIMRRTKEYIT